MKLSNIIIYSSIFTVATFSAGFFFNFIPCFSHPNIINPQMSLNFCNLDPQSFALSGVKNKYFFFTYEMSTTYITTLISSFILAFLVLSGLLRKLGHGHLGFSRKKKHKKQDKKDDYEED